MLKNKCCLYVIISIRFFSITICNLLIEIPSQLQTVSPTLAVCKSPLSPIRATCPVHLIPLTFFGTLTYCVLGVQFEGNGCQDGVLHHVTEGAYCDDLFFFKWKCPTYSKDIIDRTFTISLAFRKQCNYYSNYYYKIIKFLGSLSTPSSKSFTTSFLLTCRELTKLT